MYSCQNKIWKHVTRDVTTVCVSIFHSGTSTIKLLKIGLRHLVEIDSLVR